jgi:hypothetical protein
MNLHPVLMVLITSKRTVHLHTGQLARSSHSCDVGRRRAHPGFIGNPRMRLLNSLNASRFATISLASSGVEQKLASLRNSSNMSATIP